MDKQYHSPLLFGFKKKFEVKVIFMNFSKGLQFKKFDLHVHTPASTDYDDKNAKPEDIINSAIAKGLAGIAITDHQTGEWVDKVKEATKGKDLVVFPGVELKVHGGKDGVHVLAIFDVDKDSEHIKAFLSILKVTNQNGQPDVIANQTVIHVAKELQEFDHSAILVLAHTTSSAGVDSDMRGEQRNQIFKPEWKCLLGAEASEANFKDPKKTKDHDRVVDLFDGGYKTFFNKRMGVYQSSDAHSLNDIGKSFTYFKVDDEITLEDIRQSLIDRDTRIRQSFEYQKFNYPCIVNLKVTSGFLSDEEFKFHEGLNSVLGAKGSGKSLAIEFLRFGLGQEPNNQEIYDDHIAKLEKCLKVHGEVEIKFMDDSGKEYIIKRVYNPAENNPVGRYPIY